MNERGRRQLRVVGAGTAHPSCSLVAALSPGVTGRVTWSDGPGRYGASVSVETVALAIESTEKGRDTVPPLDQRSMRSP